MCKLFLKMDVVIPVQPLALEYGAGTALYAQQPVEEHVRFYLWTNKPERLANALLASARTDGGLEKSCLMLCEVYKTESAMAASKGEAVKGLVHENDRLKTTMRKLEIQSGNTAYLSQQLSMSQQEAANLSRENARMAQIIERLEGDVEFWAHKAEMRT